MPTPTPSPSATPSPTPTPTPTVAGFDKTAQSIDDPASYWVVVNKQRPLTVLDYEAPDIVPVPVAYVNEPYLRQAASDAAVQMFAAITAETGLELQAQSAYRSYSVQEGVYAGWVSSLGQEAADLTSARPDTASTRPASRLTSTRSPTRAARSSRAGVTPRTPRGSRRTRIASGS